jgi:cysteine desulfurase
MNLDMAGIAVAVGSACSSGSIQPPHVLRSMGLHDGIIRGAIRFSFSYQTKQDELEFVIDQLRKIFARLQGGSKHAR